MLFARAGGDPRMVVIILWLILLAVSPALAWGLLFAIVAGVALVGACFVVGSSLCWLFRAVRGY